MTRIDRRQPTRLLVIGLDGASFEVLEPLARKGQLPHLQRLMSHGLRARLRSTLPPATLPAWTSFLTAANPGRHGVSDIFVRLPGADGLQPASGHLRDGPTFLARLSQLGLRVASLGVPGTYPPEPINGVSVAGFDTPGAHRVRNKGVWPLAFVPRLDALGGWNYGVFNEMARGGRLQAAVDALLYDIDAKERVIRAVWNQEPWDLFFVHLQASDTAAHHLWHTWDTESPRSSHPELRDALPMIYARLDQLIGTLLDRLPPDVHVLLVSDHGMGGASTVAVHLNRWLQQQGLLRFATGARRGVGRAASASLRPLVGRLPPALLGAAVQRLPAAVARRALAVFKDGGVDIKNSQAFSDELDYAPSVWIQRGAPGLSAAGAVEAVRDRIQEGLLALRHPLTDAPLITAVHRREEVHSGPHLQRIPDLLVEPAWPDGYRASFLPSQGEGPAMTQLQRADWGAPKGAGMPGVHHPDGVFTLWGPGVPKGELESFGIAEAGALVYPLLGLEPPEALEASPPESVLRAIIAPVRRPATAIEEPASAPTQVQSAVAPTHVQSAAAGYSAAEEAEVTQRLRNLGYLD